MHKRTIEAMGDPNIAVDELPPHIKGLITRYTHACQDMALIGSLDADDMDQVEADFQACLYNLRRGILNELRKGEKK